MNSAVALKPGAETRWTILSGAMSGAVRVIQQSQFTIGRNPDCELVIAGDPKCSRRHADVRHTPQGCEIYSLNDKNPVLLNGREIESALLNDGDVVIVGDTEVQFAHGGRDGGGDLQIALVPQRPLPKSPQAYESSYAPEHSPQSSRPRSAPMPKGQPAPNNNKRFLIYGVIALVVGYVVLSDSEKKKEDFGLRFDQQSTDEINSVNKEKEARESENLQRVDPSLMSRQAQENYVRGFRDYRKGQYERALESFQACLAMDSKHLLCNRYLRLSQRKFNEMIQHYVLLGRKYKDQNQYQSCRAAFRNVMVMVKDANNETYKLAKANYEACNAYIEGRY